MSLRILLVNPPVYDFTAYDFWLRPYGLLSVAGRMRSKADMVLFDYMDRGHRSIPEKNTGKTDPWSRGPFPSVRIEKPDVFRNIRRYYKRFGIAREYFQRFIAEKGPFDFVLVQTSMTYWYLGLAEVVEDVRKFAPNAAIIAGGVYATLCPDHAKSLGIDLVIEGENLDPLWQMLNIKPHTYQPPLWEAYDKLSAGVMKLTNGCPFACTYCASDKIAGRFAARNIDRCIKDLQFLLNRGVTDIAFYDDALLYKPEDALIPFAEYVIENNIKINFHTPNALHARFITPDIAKLMVNAGFKTFYLGFESSSETFHEATGAKVVSDELQRATQNLVNAGADKNNITAYEMLGHPQSDLQQLEESMRFVNSLGISVMLSDFSPIPGTCDGDLCEKWVNLAEPLCHNKIAFPIVSLGEDKVNYYKDLCKKLNRNT